MDDTGKKKINSEDELKALKKELSDLKIENEIKGLKEEISKFKDGSEKNKGKDKENDFTPDVIANSKSSEFNAAEYAKSLISGKED